jgi:hypothetical protein
VSTTKKLPAAPDGREGRSPALPARTPTDRPRTSTGRVDTVPPAVLAKLIARHNRFELTSDKASRALVP